MLGASRRNMTPISLCAMITALLGGPSSSAVVDAPPPLVLKVDPPSWWAGHTINPVRLLVRGKNLDRARLISSRPDIRPASIRVSERGTYLFVDLKIDPQALPGDASLRVETSSGATPIPFRLEPPLQSGNFQVAQGIGQDDVIYLIMTDRFCDGDPSNNRPSGSPEGGSRAAISRAASMAATCEGSSIILATFKNWG